MNSCEFDIIRHLKARMNQDSDFYQNLDQIAKEVSEQIGDDFKSVKDRITDLLINKNSTIDSTPIISITEFFKVDGKYNPVAYSKVKQRVRELVIGHLFNDESLLATNDENTNVILSSMSNWFAETLSLNDGNSVSKLAFYINLNKDSKTKASYLNDYESIAHYLIAAHMPTIVNSWFKDLLVYYPETDTYGLEVNSYVRRDWYDDDSQKEAQLNSLLKLLLEATPMTRFNLDGTVDYDFVSNKYLTSNSFFYAFDKELKQMSPKEYSTFIDNPYSIIDYLRKKYSNTGGHSTLYENIIHSFFYKWFENEDGETYFYQHCKEIADKPTGFNPLDIIVKNIGKFGLNTYIETTIDNKSKTESFNRLSLSIDENSRAYSILCDNITNLLTNNTIIPNGILVKGNGQWYLSSNANIDNIAKVFFGNDVIINEGNKNNFINAINVVINFRNSSSNNLQNYLSENPNEMSFIRTILDNINAYNPYAISGSVNNALDKALPTIGLTTVAGSIKENIYRLINKNNKFKESYKHAGLRIPVSPYEHSMLFKEFKNDIESNITSESTNPFLGTVYRTTLTTTIDGTPVIKDVGQVSIPEAFELNVFTDFINQWKKAGDNIVRIQAITVSDKPKIPNFEFSTINLKRIYGNTNSEIENNVIKEIRNIYGQNLLNTLNNFAEVFEWNDLMLDSNISNVDINILLDKINILNTYLSKYNISSDILNEKLFAFNNKFGVNKLIANIHDFVKGKNSIQVSPYLIESVKFINQENPFDQLFLESLKKLPKEIDTTKLLTNNNGVITLSNTAKQSDLYTYFLLKNVLSENILVNTVGLPLTHKTKGKDYLSMDSKAHLTMVKRMVALTATMQACNANSLDGLSNEINMMTISNDIAEMFTYSGNSSSGKGFRTELDVADGAMYGIRAIDNLLKQSIADTKPKGIDLKLLMHYHNPEHGGANLAKLASYTIDNNILRTFSDDNITKVGGITPMSFMILSLRPAKFKEFSFKYGQLIDYNGEDIDLNDIYVKEWDDTINDYKIYEISDVIFDGQKFHATKTEIVNGEYTDNISNIDSDNNLYSFWKNILGGEYSCDFEGNYGEQSQDKLSEILNKVGKKIKDTSTPLVQQDVDQYLKKSVVHYFPTNSGQKSLKMPIVDIRKALLNPNKAYTIKTGIENFGIQLDADHSAADGEIHEITQLISFITEHGYVPEKVSSIYNGLANLVKLLSNKTFVNVDLIRDPEQRSLYKQQLDNIFGPKLIRVFTNPNADTISLANEIMKELGNLENNITKLITPYSDHQIIGKMHTTIGSYLNKFISRNWNGRGDVLVPSHNMFMVYEDDNGVIFTVNDFKFNLDGSKIKASKYLHDKVWYKDQQGKEFLRTDFIDSHLVTPYEVMPVDVYYRISPENNEVSIKVIDNWNDLKLVSDEIKNGVKYVKAIDLPRNLRSKRAFIDVTTTEGNIIRIGLFHFKTLRLISDIGDILDDNVDITKYPQDQNGNILYNGIYRDKSFFSKEKRRLQNYFNETVLKGIKDKNINIISSEIPDNINIKDFNYVVYNAEKATTNNYSNKFGIKNMNFSEIMQKKEDYFKENLLKKFDDFLDFNLNYDYLLYTSKGTPTIVYTKLTDDIKKFVPGEVIVNEDGYRLDQEGNIMYKWPENAKLYSYTFGNKSIDVILLDNINNILNDGNFVFYKSKFNLNGQNLYKLTPENINIIINTLANIQYKSWLKSNTSVMARIPSQSLSFAMNIDTVVYLPYNNNIAFVPNEQVFLQGSDYDIDKAYSIMAGLNNNGVYKGLDNNINIINEVINEDDLSDVELEFFDRVASVIINYYNADMNSLLDSIVEWINSNNYSNIRISKPMLYNYLSYNYSVDRNDPGNKIQLLNLSQEEKNKLYKNIDNVLDALNLKLFILSGLNKFNNEDNTTVQNIMLSNIIDIYNDPRTLFAASYPTTMDPINDVVKDFDLEASKRNHFDITTDIYVNQTTSVGKIGIGISATAQKAFYALTYYNLMNYQNGKSLLNPTIIKLHNDWVYDTNIIFSLGFADSKYNLETIQDLQNWIESSIESNDGYIWTIYKQQGNTTIYQLTDKTNNIKYNVFSAIKTEEFGNKFVYLNSNLDINNIDNDLITEEHRIKIGDNITDFIVTTVNSSIISSATDNAKEMKLDLLNMTPEVMPAYEYCISIGMSLYQAAKIFTDPIIPFLIAKAKGNLYKEERGSRIANILNTSLQGLSNEFIGNTSYVEKLSILKKIFKGANELHILGRTLGINGGINVEMGSPLLYQLKFERDIKNMSNSDTNFSLEEFLSNADYREIWINKLNDKKQTYNILDILSSVPHYMAMLNVPVQFKNIVQILSKDIDNSYNIIYKNLKYKYKIDDLTIKSVLKVLNDRKIFEFLKTLDFKYSSPLVLEQKKNDIKILNTFTESISDIPQELSTSNLQGLITLKTFIERFVIKELQTNNKYKNNAFVKNLVYNTQINPLFGERVGAYASRLSTTDLANTDLINMIKSDLYDIQNDIIEGHSVYEWLFLYDLLIYKRSLNKNSLSIFLDGNIDLNNTNSILYKYIDYINKYDDAEFVYTTLTELGSLPKLEKLRSEDNFIMDNMENFEDISPIYFKKRPSWSINPNYLPLFVDLTNFGYQTLISKNLLSKTFAKGILLATVC